MRIKGGLTLAFSGSGNPGKDQFAISSTASNAPPTQRKYRTTGIHSSAPRLHEHCHFTPPSPDAAASTQDGRDAWRRFNSRRASCADPSRNEPIVYLAWLILLIQIKANEQ